MHTDKRSNAATDAERKRAERERKREAGLVPVQVWVRPEHAQAVREYADRLVALRPMRR